MKKALAFVSALIFASASQSDNELRLRPVSYNPNEDFPLEDFLQTFPRKFPRDLPPVVYADDDELRVRSIDFVPEEFLLDGSPYDEQSHLKTQPKQAPFKPLPVQNQPKIKEETIESALYQLGQLIKQGVEVKSREHGTRIKSKSQYAIPSWKSFTPSNIPKEFQQTMK